MILTLYLTYMFFVTVAFGSLVRFVWSISEPAAILFGGFTVLAVATKFLGELYLQKKRDVYTQALISELQKSGASKTTESDVVVPINTKGMN